MNKAYENWLRNVDEKDKSELLSLKDNPREIEERFYRELQFGTAGMRGEVGLGTYRMNLYTVRRATAGVAQYVKSVSAENRGVVIAYDTRRFSKEFAIAASEVLAAFGIKVFLYEGVRPVPMCSFGVRYLKAIAGIMITASHNPKEYNGYKVYGADGAQMAPDATAEVVKFIDETDDYFNVPRKNLSSLINMGKEGFEFSDPYVKVIGREVDEEYFKAVEKLSLSPELTKKYGDKIKLVYTPVHGTGRMPVSEIFRRLGIKAEFVNEQLQPDTEFSTVKVPNPENAETLSMGIALGNKVGADVVLATDPDADRLGAAVRNDKGEFVLLTGNQIGVLLLDYILNALKEKGELVKNGAIVRSFVTTTLADRIAADYGVKTFSVLTGFKYIGEKIAEWERTKEYVYLFGFEESFGSLRGTHARDKDAVVASMLFAEATIYWERKGKTIYDRLQEIFSKYGFYTERNLSIAYKGISGMTDMAEVMKKLHALNYEKLDGEKIVFAEDYLTLTRKYSDGKTEHINTATTDAIRLELENKQFICIRPSGTEPKLKLYALVLAENADKSAKKAEILLDAVKALL